MKIYLQHNEVAMAVGVMKRIDTLKSLIITFLPVDTLAMFIDFCVKENDATHALVNQHFLNIHIIIVPEMIIHL